MGSLALGALLIAWPSVSLAQDGDPPPADPPRPDPALAPIDVTAHGDKEEENGSRRLGRREIREMPGVLNDPFRSIEISPGVTPIATGIPYYFVRGAPPGNLGTYYEGVSVPLLFHVGAGPGVLPAPLVDHVDLHLGPYPVSLGRIAGGVVDAKATDPTPDRWHGEGTFRVLDMGGFVEGPIAEGATVLVGGHGSIGTAILSALVPEVDLGYADYQTRLALDTSSRDRVTVLAFGSYDYLAAPNTTELDDVLLDSDFHRLDARWDHRESERTTTRLGATVGLDRSRGQSVEQANDWKIGMRGHVIHAIDGAVLRAGGDIAIDAVDTEFAPTPCEGFESRGVPCPLGLRETYAASMEGQLDRTFRQLFPDRTDVAVGGWADAQIALGPRSTITPGVRVDVYTSMGESDIGVDPRLMGRFGVGEHLHLVPAIGIASQPPGFPPVPGLVVGGLPGPLQRSLQSSFGVERRFGPIAAEMAVFRQAIFNVNDPLGGERGGGFNTDRFLRRSTGDAYGLELSALGPLRRDLFFYAAYTLSRSTRRANADEAVAAGGVPATIPAAYDRTHVGQLALLYDFGRGWRGGLRYMFYTGFPADEINPYRDRVVDPERTSPFFRMDARISKRWVLGATSWVGVVFDMQNVTLAKETFDVQCDDLDCDPRKFGPIAIPTLALEAGF
jgi:hypothetical protein